MEENRLFRVAPQIAQIAEAELRPAVWFALGVVSYNCALLSQKPVPVIDYDRVHGTWVDLDLLELHRSADTVQVIAQVMLGPLGLEAVKTGDTLRLAFRADCSEAEKKPPPGVGSGPILPRSAQTIAASTGEFNGPAGRGGGVPERAAAGSAGGGREGRGVGMVGQR